jgi:diacylglycerol kinase (ATP)
LINIKTLIRAFQNSLDGLAHALKSERAFRQEIILLIAGSIAAFLLTDASVERAILIGSIALVLIVELLNSAIEATIDRIGPEIHPLAKNAKDLGSAAVLISLLTVAAMWLIILV